MEYLWLERVTIGADRDPSPNAGPWNFTVLDYRIWDGDVYDERHSIKHCFDRAGEIDAFTVVGLHSSCGQDVMIDVSPARPAASFTR